MIRNHFERICWISIVIGWSKNQNTVLQGVRQSISQTYLKEARSRSNLHIITGAHVTKVLFQGIFVHTVNSPIKAPPPIEAYWVFLVVLAISQPKMVLFSICKKPLEGETALSIMRARPDFMVIFESKNPWSQFPIIT